MKKFLLSLSLAATFLAYLLTYKHADNNGDILATANASPVQPADSGQADAASPLPWNSWQGDSSTVVLLIDESQTASSIITQPTTTSPQTVVPAKPRRAVAAVPPPPKPIPVPKPPIRTGLYKEGSYTGDVADAYYGNVQIRAVIQNGRLSNVQFLDYPHDRGTSIAVNTYAMPLLTSEAIRAQSANVDIVSGATATSGAFQQSLASALSRAKS